MTKFGLFPNFDQIPKPAIKQAGAKIKLVHVNYTFVFLIGVKYNQTLLLFANLLWEGVTKSKNRNTKLKN